MLQKLISATPLMRPVDAVKLAYQRAFGIGHLLADVNAAAARLEAELASTPPDDGVEAFTPIGRGLCRLNLASAAVRALPAATLASAMRVTESRFTPSQEAFERSLAELRELAERGEAPFTLVELDEYLSAYRAEGCPAVSHSDVYREAYLPAYRVVLSDIGVLLPALSAIEQRLSEHKRALVAIDGDCGGGKTTLADIICGLYGAQVIHMDDFFLPFERRIEERRRVAGWCVDWERFRDEALHGLARGGTLDYRRYDCATGGYLPRRCEPAPLTIIEGSYSHHPGLSEAYLKLDPIKIFVRAEMGEQLKRLAARDPERLSRFMSEWIPLEKSYFEAYDICRRADVCLLSLAWEDEL